MRTYELLAKYMDVKGIQRMNYFTFGDLGTWFG